MTDNLKLSIYDMDLSVRAFNALIRASKRDLDSILAIATYGELRKIKNIGPKNAADVINKIRSMGFHDWADRINEDG